MTRVSVVRGISAAALVALTLAGCVSAPPDPTPTSSIAAMPEAQVVAGSGSQEVELDLPSGAESLLVRLACSSGRFYLWTMQMGQERSGACGGMAVLNLGLSQSSPMHVTIEVDQETSVVAQLQFSADPIPVDTPLAQDCDAISAYLNDVTNADVGFSIGELDLGQWSAKIGDGVAWLQDMTPTPVIEPLVEPLIEWGTSAEAPGVFTTSIPPSAAAAQNLAQQICADGNRAVVLIGEYGG